MNRRQRDSILSTLAASERLNPHERMAIVDAVIDLHSESRMRAGFDDDLDAPIPYGLPPDGDL